MKRLVTQNDITLVIQITPLTVTGEKIAQITMVMAVIS
jgi:hypothetical protein